MKRLLVLVTIAVFLGVGIASHASAATAALNQASANKKGSLLIFPKIDVKADLDIETVDGLVFDKDAYISIGNDGNKDVTLECIWQYPNIASDNKTQNCCGTQNFTLKLTPGQVRYFSAGTGFADVLGSGIFSSVNMLPRQARGLASLTCFAVNPNTLLPIQYNQLYGEVTNVQWNLTADIVPHATLTSWGYNAYAFASNGKPVFTKKDDGSVVLSLNGMAGGYDACADRLTFNFLAKQQHSMDSFAPAVWGTDLTLIPCTRDLREFTPATDPVVPGSTLAVFSIWNQREEKLSGTSACVKCFFEQVLGETYPMGAPTDAFRYVNGDNFNFWPQHGGLGTMFGRARVDGKQAACPPGGSSPVGFAPVESGLLGVAYDFLDVYGGKDTEVALGTFAPDGYPEMTSGRVLTFSGQNQPGGDTIRYSRDN